MDTIDVAKTKALEAFLAGDHQTAEILFLRIIDRAIDDSDSLMMLGNIQMEKGLKGLALQLYRRAVQCNRNNFSAQFNLGCALFQCKHTDEAVSIYAGIEKALIPAIANPKTSKEQLAGCKTLLADVYGNWSGVYVNNGTPGKAIELGKKGLAINPEHPHATNHTSLGLMEQGKWAEAWPFWEKRYRLHHMNTRNYHTSGTTPLWSGKEKIGVLAVHGEQGLGDEIMFLSALPDLLKTGLVDKVIVECAPRIQSLVQRSFPDVQCYPSHNTLMHEWHDKIEAKLPMGSLFPIYRPEGPEDCPGTPFIVPSANLRDEYHDRLKTLGNGLKVGITWRGGTEKTHEEVRKVTLEKWKPILDVPGCRFISLQYTEGSDAEADNFGIPQWKLAIDDLDRHAALIAELDLVISVCQTSIHIAGAIGKECWVLTPSRPRWCYGKSNREDMPLYNSVRLFRQKNDNWPEVIEKVAASLREKVTLKEAA